MAGVGAGIGGIGFAQKLWVLTDLDTGDSIVGQFIAQSLTKNVESTIAEATSVNRENPVIQWVHGGLETVTFTARLWALYSSDFSAEDKLQRLEELATKQDDPQRPPICSFAVADIPSLEIDCLVASLGGITYDEPRLDGTLRGVTLQVSLKRFEEIDFQITDPSVPETFTRKRRAKKGDTYESIAADEYGNPELGILLRQLNPRIPGMALADLNPKDPVHIYPEEHLLTLPVEPQFHALKRGPHNEAAHERRRQIFDARADDSFVTIFGDTAPKEF